MIKTMRPVVAGAVAIALVAAVGTTVITTFDEACAASRPVTSFAEDVFPIFKGRCISCHAPDQEGYEKSGLDLTTYAGLMKGTKFGVMVVPRDPDSSNLMWLLDWRASPEMRMPHGKKKLSICDRSTIRAWILEGAKDN